MRLYWIFIIDRTPKSTFQALESNTAKFAFSQFRNFGGSIGDLVVVLDLESTNGIFKYDAEISSINLETEDREKSYIIGLTKMKAIDPPNILDDFAYTISRIKNFERPISHFENRNYRRISYAEYLAISNSQFFIGRTAFGKLVNALHLEHRRAFVQMLLDKDFELFRYSKDYNQAMLYLEQYLGANIYPHMTMLQESYGFLKEILSQSEQSDTISQVGFAEEGKNGDLLGVQVNVINTFLERNNVTRIRSQVFNISEELTETEKAVEIKLNTLFRNTPLPINLN
jgi:hypothetical protein